MNQHVNNCPKCGRCYCGVTKTVALDGSIVCAICKPGVDQKIIDANNQHQPR